MGNASGHQCKVKMSGRKKNVNENGTEPEKNVNVRPFTL